MLTSTRTVSCGLQSDGTGRINRNSVRPILMTVCTFFDMNNPAAGVTKYDMANLAADTAYGVLVDDSPAGADVKVYVTSLEGSALYVDR